MAQQEVRYPDVTVKLTGVDGNAFVLIGTVSKALQQVRGEEAAAGFRAVAMQCTSYEALLTYIQDTVHVR
jgi:hypothetical protein